MSKTILIADDKTDIRNLVSEHLESEGFRIVIAAGGREALFAARQERPDLILLNILTPVTPEMSGYDFIKACRKERETPIILLTTKLDETDKYLGLELGADDYIAWPFDMKELVVRINAVLHRAGHTIPEPETLSVGGIQLNKNSRVVKSFGRPVSLTPSEFDLLYALISAPGKVFSRSDLLQKLQSNVFEGTERSVDVHIRNLRTKIEPSSSKPIYIETVFGAGYRFNPG